MKEQPESVSRPARTRGSRRPASPLARIGTILFAIGILAVAVIMALFATGATELPLWLNLAAMLAPVGFGVGLIGVFLEARTARTAAAAARHSRTSPPARPNRIEYPA